MQTKLFGVLAGLALAFGVLTAAPGTARAGGGGDTGSGLDRGTEAARANDRTGGVRSGPGRRRYHRANRYRRYR
ncbi:hypothetical protein [Methylobacterium brachiatum]|uniref:hypothetical protein n=1 Tax=Methylobacterium brachiatum TaxID=269660 RepID=UPI002449D7E4|nr:hypothetical protein [Methylobacterium brachiatum]MDH2313256.1 hypothetical protein [Methylobacterium brachiatum]